MPTLMAGLKSPLKLMQRALSSPSQSRRQRSPRSSATTTPVSTATINSFSSSSSSSSASSSLFFTSSSSKSPATRPRFRYLAQWHTVAELETTRRVSEWDTEACARWLEHAGAPVLARVVTAKQLDGLDLLAQADKKFMAARRTHGMGEFEAESLATRLHALEAAAGGATAKDVARAFKAAAKCKAHNSSNSSSSNSSSRDGSTKCTDSTVVGDARARARASDGDGDGGNGRYALVATAVATTTPNATGAIDAAAAAAAAANNNNTDLIPNTPTRRAAKRAHADASAAIGDCSYLGDTPARLHNSRVLKMRQELTATAVTTVTADMHSSHAAKRRIVPSSLPSPWSVEGAENNKPAVVAAAQASEPKQKVRGQGEESEEEVRIEIVPGFSFGQLRGRDLSGISSTFGTGTDETMTDPPFFDQSPIDISTNVHTDESYTHLQNGYNNKEKAVAAGSSDLETIFGHSLSAADKATSMLF